MSDNRIEPRTAIGEATAQVLGFNVVDRLLERKTLQAIGHYPTDGEVGSQ